VKKFISEWPSLA